MARIAGVDLPKNKQTVVALTYIYGIGHSCANEIVQKANVEGQIKIKDLKEDEVKRLREVIDKDYKVEGALRQEVTFNIKRLMDLGCYRGLRHRRGLPVRGQRTHTNARTRKGRKHRIGGGRK